MKTFFEPLSEIKEYEDVVDAVKKHNTPVHVSGCVEGSKAHMLMGIGEQYDYRLVVTTDEIRAKKIVDDLKLYSHDVYYYPAKDIIFFSADIHGNAIVRERMKVIRNLVEGKSCTIVTTIEAGMDKLLPLEEIVNYVYDIKPDDEIDLTKLATTLTEIGYTRTQQVEEPGDFSIRGGIVDIFDLTSEAPVRIEMWDTVVDTIRMFDVMSQRSIEQLDSVTIYPASEYILSEDRIKSGFKKIENECKKHSKKLRDKMMSSQAANIERNIGELIENIEIYKGAAGVEGTINYFYEGTVDFTSYFQGRDTICFMDEPARIEEKILAVGAQFDEAMKNRLEDGYILPGQIKCFNTFKSAISSFAGMNMVSLSVMDYNVTSIKYKAKYTMTTKTATSYGNNFSELVEDLKKYKKNGYRAILVCGSHTRAARLCQDLIDEELNAFESDDMDREVMAREIMIVHGSMSAGFEYPLIKFVVISDTDIFGKTRKVRKKKKYSGKEISAFSDLKVGDYVVHENHGLGVYKGIEKIEVDHVVKDYIKIEYADGGNLYVLASGLDVIQKYAGADAKTPKLNKLGTSEWKKTKTKVKTAVDDIAKDLVELYAKRREKKGFSFSEDNLWQHEFEELFPFDETQDQLEAIEATKKDMESTCIMDRLVCGDVGYGKTEIAIRAAFKAVQDNKQVVFLVPTTILAQQHYNTFVQRMKDYPINIDMLSRFRTGAMQKKTVEDLKSGRADIVIGTHRLLSADVEFKRLGLLIIDEEQRFGVAHKEKIKKMKEDVDVLALSATPIPRTLHMSLVGIRDMSVLEEPPVDRLPIQTFVLERNDEMIREAIMREASRDGQVYYVYNRVNSIADMANHIASLVPELNVEFAHGQMSPRELEKIMFSFINGEIDVLVATTIVETGLDISNVNTIIIDDADRLGLSQLYQLRGRVGRSNRTSYAFLMYSKNKVLREEAQKRLQAIREFTELGSGFKIAMKDLEIRGAGNILGERQHGHMAAVGYDLYCKMLNEAVLELKGVKKTGSFDTAVELNISAFIPATYIKSEYIKLGMYKRIADIESAEEYETMIDEMVDRFGDMPDSVVNLIDIALIKAYAHGCDMTKVKQKGDVIRLDMYERARVDVEKIPEYIKKNNGTVSFVPGNSPYFSFKPRGVKGQDNLLKTLKEFLLDFKDNIIMEE